MTTDLIKFIIVTRKIWRKIGLGHETSMTETRRWYVSRPSRDRDHNPGRLSNQLFNPFVSCLAVASSEKGRKPRYMETFRERWRFTSLHRIIENTKKKDFFSVFSWSFACALPHLVCNIDYGIKSAIPCLTHATEMASVGPTCCVKDKQLCCTVIDVCTETIQLTHTHDCSRFKPDQ